MELGINGKRTIAEPRPEDIRDALGEMDDSNNDFLILEVRPWTYMQCAGDTTVGFALEYQEGSLDKHFSVEGGKVDAETVLRAFTSYLVGDGAWRSEWVWEKMDL